MIEGCRSRGLHPGRVARVEAGIHQQLHGRRGGVLPGPGRVAGLFLATAAAGVAGHARAGAAAVRADEGTRAIRSARRRLTCRSAERRPRTGARPGVHDPAQAPFVHTNWHAWPDCQSPAEVQVCGALLLQSVCPGLQTPVQAPWLQTNGHAWPFSHMPSTLHDCGTPDELHWRAPGMQTPVQSPCRRRTCRRAPTARGPASRRTGEGCQRRSSNPGCRRRRSFRPNRCSSTPRHAARCRSRDRSSASSGRTSVRRACTRWD